MLRAGTHIGLAALLVIAPALCCCNVRLLAGQIASSSAPVPTCPVCPQPEPALPSCCQSAKPTTKASCCHAQEPVKSESQNQSKPAAPKQQRCDFCGDRPDAMPPKTPPTLADPEPTGELIALAVLGLTTISPEHLGLIGGLDPPERAGVDTRFESLFVRHVLRC